MNSEMVKRFVYRQNDIFSEMPFSAKGTERYEGRITWTMTTIGYIKYREVPLALNGIAENL